MRFQSLQTPRQSIWAIVACGFLLSTTSLAIQAETPAGTSMLDDWRAGFNQQLDDEVAALESAHPVQALPPAAAEPGQYDISQISDASFRMNTGCTFSSLKAKYLSAVVRNILTSEGMPPGLEAVVHVESGFNLMAVSPKGAAGLWQFMPATAREYGLIVTATQDDRFDVFKSTVAAAHYLRELHYQFNNWPLALAAYNAGPNRVSKAMHRLGTHDFWLMSRSLSLPGETVDYVSNLLAVPRFP